MKHKKTTSVPFTHLFLTLAISGLLVGPVVADNSGINHGNASGSNLSALEGVWESQGYGYLLEIGAKAFRLYDSAPDYCAANPNFAGTLEEFPEPFLVNPTNNRLRISFGDPAYMQTLVRIKNLPLACSQEPKTDAKSVFAVFDAIFRQHYPFFRERGVDWPKMVDKARRAITIDTDSATLFNTLAGLISQIDDSHISISAKIDGELTTFRAGRGETAQALIDLAAASGISIAQQVQDWRAAVEAETDSQILGGQGITAGNGWVRYGLINGNIGYLGISAEANFAEDNGDDGAAIEHIMDEAMAVFAPARAVIVDLSINFGGDDRLARRIASRFATTRTVAYSKFAGDADGAKPQPMFIGPTPRPGYRGPVYLLTSDHTVGAGEVLTLSLRALPNVIHAGQATRGALSGILSKALPNGWTLAFGNEIYLDHEGIAWEGKGIPPGIEIPVFSRANPLEGHKAAVDQVITIIGR